MRRSRQTPSPRRGTPYSTKSRASRSSTSSAQSFAPSTGVEKSQVNCEYSPDGERMTFHLPTGTSYTITPAESSPEHFWGTIYSAEWSHPDASQQCICAIKASDFQLRQGDGNDLRAEYRRPRTDFEREVRTFQNTRHRNVLEMYDFWEWEGRGYIALKKMKGSLGDVLYESAHRSILNELRSNEAVLAELLRQVFPLCIKLRIRF